ncbi:hypothetical protein N0V87_004839 [Didymella glomerata]|uniref:Uncharacterized protein n=1 Tax=Didymella glomerata TaxID=749621 RepID=A0A9W9C0A6_9PLEO|nr:hypothetical protein N0V87_004839 [Didymella glomerata]
MAISFSQTSPLTPRNSALSYDKLQDKLAADLYLDYDSAKYFLDIVLPDGTTEEINSTCDLKAALYRAKPKDGLY